MEGINGGNVNKILNTCKNNVATEINTSEKSGIHWLSERKKNIVVRVIEKSPENGNSIYYVTK